MLLFLFKLFSYFIFSFRFFLDGQPLLASGGTSGVISIWNLEKRRLQSVIKDAHDNSILSLHFFSNEPVLMSSSADNSVKVSLLKDQQSSINFFENCYMQFSLHLEGKYYN